MRFATDSKHRDFFSKHRYIEFEGLLSLNECEVLRQGIDQLLAKRLKISFPELERQTPSVLFSGGRDLWRRDGGIKKILLKSSLAEIAAALFNLKSLRIGYDQLLITKQVAGSPFLTPSASLSQISCLQPLSCGLILALHSYPEEKIADSFYPIPQKAGSGIFFSPLLPIDWNLVFQMAHLELILIVYCPETTIYSLEKNDPNTHTLKKEGHVFGDKLKNNTHPLVFH